MAVTSVGTPVQARTTTSGSASVTGTWPTGSTQVAGNILVAAVLAGGITSSTAISTPAGWTEVGEATDGTTLRVAFFWAIAAGGDPAPTFTSTTSGTTVMTCTLYELAGGNTANPVDTSGTNSGTALAVTVTTSGNVSAAGSYAIGHFGYRPQTSITITWTPGTGFTNDVNDGGTASRFHSAQDHATSAPATGAALSESVTWSAGTPQNTSSMIVVFGPAVAGGILPAAQPGQTWLRRFHHRQALPQFPAAGVTAVALPETGAADDTSLVVAATVPLAEAGAGADTLAVTATVPLAEAGSGADTLAVSAAVPLAESGSAADTLAVNAAVPLAESGAGADALAVTATVPLAEAGSGADSLTVAATVPLAESGTGTDTLSVNAGGTPALAETGTGTDSLTVTATVPLAEAGSAAQTLAVLAQAALAEAGAALDTLAASAPGLSTPGTLTAFTAPGATLTASDATTGVLATATASGTLTAVTAAAGTTAYAAVYGPVYGPQEGVLTATDQRTGGPS